MKLKKLEILGFKSFCDKISIEFPVGISAIVGPNGCGKSNILDALRWVMGEQSVKQLRGKAMEDVIFSGTNGRPPLNMAEVSLILLNDNKTAPDEFKDFLEIMVTRRLYRSGESGYFLNKQPCRLKDINNLFMGSGIGHRNYAIIQQGNIGAITDAGPEERRFFIEEAAGVTRYKNHKKESEQKVDSTNQNLFRINDIILEVKIHMDSLKHQAQRAELYKKLQETAINLDRSLSLRQYKELTNFIDNKVNLLKEMQNEETKLGSQLKKLEAEIESVKLEQTQQSQAISEKKANHFKMLRKADKIENDVIHFKNEVERLKLEIIEFISGKNILEERIKSIENEIFDIENQQIKFQDEIRQKSAILNENQLNSKHIKDESTKLSKKLEIHKNSFLDLTTNDLKYKNLCQNATKNKEKLTSKLKRIDEEILSASDKVSELQNEEAKNKKNIDTLKEEINDLSSQIAKNQVILEEINKDLIKHIRLIQSMESDRNSSISRYSAIKKMNDNYEWYKDGVKAIMKKEDDDNLKKEDIFCLVADILEPKLSFETAAEIVLGEKLQYFIVKNHEVAFNAINYLKRKELGRTGFIPINLTEGDTIIPDSKLLLNHLTLKKDFEKIGTALLGNTIVCDSINEALKLLKDDPQIQIVTKDGQMLSKDGIIVGGSKDKSSGIFEKKLELKELEEKIKDFDKKIEKANQAQKEIEEKAKNNEINLEKLKKDKSFANSEQIEIEKILYKISQDLKHAKRHLEIVNLEQEQLSGEENDTDEEINNYNLILAKISKQLQEEEKSIKEITEKLNEIFFEIEAFNDNVMELKLQLNTLNNKFESDKNSLKRLKDFQSDGIKRLDHIIEDIKAKEQKQLSSKLKIIEYEQNLKILYEDIHLLDESIKVYEIRYQEVDNELRNNDKKIIETNDKREKFQKKMRYFEIEISEKSAKKEGITNRIKERYHKSLEDLCKDFIEPNNYSKILDFGLESELSGLRKQIEDFGDVNLGAIKEYEQSKERYNFLTNQHDDLVNAISDLHKVINKINKIMEERFLETFNSVNQKLAEVFPKLFEGGSAQIILTEPEKLLETGVEFLIHPPGKKLTRMSLLSGGEKALSAIAFIFSIFLINPTAFCLMDEIDAPLDDANVLRFNNLLKIIGENSQVILITHKTRSMEFADTLLGVTMENKGISKIVSVNF